MPGYRARARTGIARSSRKKHGFVKKKEHDVHKHGRKKPSTATLVALDAAAPAKKVAEMRQRMNVTQEVFGRLIGSSTRTIAQVEGGKRPSSSVERALTEAWRLYERLSEVIKEEDFARWIRKPNPVFGGFQPLQLIEAGRTDQLWQMVYELESGQLA
jgi:DNA-binding transcriptional regulator YiaG